MDVNVLPQHIDGVREMSMKQGQKYQPKNKKKKHTSTFNILIYYKLHYKIC